MSNEFRNEMGERIFARHAGMNPVRLRGIGGLARLPLLDVLRRRIGFERLMPDTWSSPAFTNWGFQMPGGRATEPPVPLRPRPPVEAVPVVNRQVVNETAMNRQVVSSQMDLARDAGPVGDRSETASATEDTGLAERTIQRHLGTPLVKSAGRPIIRRRTAAPVTAESSPAVPREGSNPIAGKLADAAEPGQSSEVAGHSESPSSPAQEHAGHEHAARAIVHREADTSKVRRKTSTPGQSQTHRKMPLDEVLTPKNEVRAAEPAAPEMEAAQSGATGPDHGLASRRASTIRNDVPEVSSAAPEIVHRAEIHCEPLNPPRLRWKPRSPARPGRAMDLRLARHRQSEMMCPKFIRQHPGLCIARRYRLRASQRTTGAWRKHIEPRRRAHRQAIQWCIVRLRNPPIASR